jgi:hypothetical protein
MIRASGLNHDIERLTTAIRDVFLVHQDLSESAVQKLHNELLAYVTEVNARLKQCDELLRRGLRQEALQESEEEPNLLELVTLLDFPEWDAWADYVVQFGLPPQPPMLLDVAAELNQAYTTAQSLEGLLKMHRLHALARSSLGARLTVLRAIAKRDPANPSWQSDLRAYETERLKQLQLEFKSHNRTGNLRAVAELRRELEHSEWSVPPQSTFATEIIAGHHRLIAEDARRHLAMLESQINHAFAAFDVSMLQQALDTWNRYWPLANLPADDPMVLRVRPAASWLEDEINQKALQAEYERDLAAMDAALDDDKSRRHDIVRLHGALERYEESIPPRLQRRYDERLLSLDVASRRKHKLVLATSVLTVLLVAAIIGLLTFQQFRTSEIAAAEHALNKFIEDNQPQHGTQFYEQLLADKPNVANAPQIQAAYARVQGQFNDELERQDRLERLITDANQLIATPNWESVSATGKLLEEARAIANDDDRYSILVVERSLQKVTSDLQRHVDTQFEQDATRLREAVGSDATPMGEARQLLQQAQTLRQRERVSETARQASGIDIVIRKLNDRIKHLTQSQNVQELLQKLIQACGQESLYKLAMQQYLEFDVKSPRANDFRHVLDHDIPLIGSNSEWNTTAAAWNSLSLESVNDANSGLKLIDTLKKDFSKYPAVDDVIGLRPYVETIAAREKPDGSTLVGELRELLKDNLFNTKQLKNPRQDSYLYYFGEPLQKGNAYELVTLLDSRDWSKTKIQRLSSDQFAAAKALTESEDTPQKTFADRANRALANTDASYEHKLCGILHILFADDDMDAILKCWLLQAFYDRGAPGSSILTEELRSFRRQLESKYTLSDTNVLDRGDPQVTTIRANTADLLNRISNSPKDVYLERIKPRVRKAIDETVQLPRIEWCGLLLRSFDGTWKVESVGSPQAKGELALLGKNDEGELQLDVIGAFDGKSFALTQDRLSYLEGRPVFLIAQQ